MSTEKKQPALLASLHRSGDWFEAVYRLAWPSIVADRVAAEWWRLAVLQPLNLFWESEILASFMSKDDLHDIIWHELQTLAVDTLRAAR